MAWGDQASGAYAANKSNRTGKFGYLVERDRRLYGRPIYVDADGSTVSASWVTLDTLSDVPLPVYVENAVDTVKLKARLQGRIGSGDTGNLRISVGSNTGTTSANITSASYVDVDVECTIASQVPADADVIIEGITAAGGLLEMDVDGALFWFEVA